MANDWIRPVIYKTTIIYFLDFSKQFCLHIRAVFFMKDRDKDKRKPTSKLEMFCSHVNSPSELVSLSLIVHFFNRHIKLFTPVKDKSKEIIESTAKLSN